MVGCSETKDTPTGEVMSKLNEHDIRYIKLLLQRDIDVMEYEDKTGEQDYQKSIVRANTILEKVRKI